MALEAINEIKEAEKKAEMIISEAKQNAKEIVSGATKEADIKYDEIISEAKAKANNLLNAALEEGNSNTEPILKIGEKEIEAIRNMSQDLKDNAINIVVERIVKIHGNS